MTRLLSVAAGAVLLVQASVASADMILQSLDPKQHDRFYDPSDPQKAFIGDPYDWSGVGRVSAVGGASRWATMISPSYFLSAAHLRPATGATLDFYRTNDPSETPEQQTVTSGWRIAGSDLWLGKLQAPVSEDIATYPIFRLSDAEDYDDLEIYTFGLSVGRFSATPTTVRLGRNNVDPGSIDSRTVGEPPNDHTGESFLFDFDNPGGVGADESYLQGGDSGGPSFAIRDGSPALVGIHWFIGGNPNAGYSGDTFLCAYFDELDMAVPDERLIMWPEPRPGDAELDGDVDFADFNQLANHYGKKTQATWSDGDFDDDDDVDFADFNALANHYTGSLDAAAKIVPEPSTLVALVTAGILFFLAAGLRGRRA